MIRMMNIKYSKINTFWSFNSCLRTTIKEIPILTILIRKEDLKSRSLYSEITDTSGHAKAIKNSYFKLKPVRNRTREGQVLFDIINSID